MSNRAGKAIRISLELSGSWCESVSARQFANLLEPNFFVRYMLILVSEVPGQFKHHLRFVWSKARVRRISYRWKQLLEVQTVSCTEFVPFREILSLHTRLPFSCEDALRQREIPG